MKKITWTIIACFLFVQLISGQDQETFPDSVKYKKNVIRWNVTPFLLWGLNNLNLGYERIYQPHKSFSVNAGNFELPDLISGVIDSVNIERSKNKAGFTISADHRWYFKRRNPRLAPDGLYWGVYGSYHYLRFNNSLSIRDSPVITGELILDAKANILSAGVELGYQFIIKERLSIDLVLVGPSLTMYSTTLKLRGSIDAAKENEYLQAIYDILSSTIPGFQELVGEGKVVSEGVNNSIGPGFRYLIQVGYRF